MDYTSISYMGPYTQSTIGPLSSPRVLQVKITPKLKNNPCLGCTRMKWGQKGNRGHRKWLKNTHLCQLFYANIFGAQYTFFLVEYPLSMIQFLNYHHVFLCFWVKEVWEMFLSRHLNWKKNHQCVKLREGKNMSHTKFLKTNQLLTNFLLTVLHEIDTKNTHMKMLGVIFFLVIKIND